MNMADRIQYLRKTKGISQEELADKIGVSRQAVSKWESEQSSPDLEKVIVMSDLFGVTTDYILKGIEPIEDKEQKSKEFSTKILHLCSTALIAIGLLCIFGGWDAEKPFEVLGGSMIIQVVGILTYFIGNMLSKVKAPILVKWFNIILVLLAPIIIATGYITSLFIKEKFVISPFINSPLHIVLFIITILFVTIISYLLLKKFDKE